MDVRSWIPALVTVAILPSHPTASAQDRLGPEPGVLAEDGRTIRYLAKLSSLLLGESPSETARVVCMPSFRPEWAVTIVTRRRGEDFPERVHFIEFTTVAPAGDDGGPE